MSENQTTIRRGRTVAIFPSAAALGAALIEATGNVEIVNVIKSGRNGEVDPDAQPVGYMMLVDGQPCTVCRVPVQPAENTLLATLSLPPASPEPRS